MHHEVNYKPISIELVFQGDWEFGPQQYMWGLLCKRVWVRSVESSTRNTVLTHFLRMFLCHETLWESGMVLPGKSGLYLACFPADLYVNAVGEFCLNVYVIMFVPFVVSSSKNK